MVNMSFADDFKKKCADIEAEIHALVDKPCNYKQPKAQPAKEASAYYNIQKRSLPPGLDQTIVYRVTKDEADLWKRMLKAKIISYEDHGPRTVHYYDVVRDDGYKAGIYENDVAIVKEEGSDISSAQIEITRDYSELDWRD
jgi:hypothetical protein